MFFVCSIRRPPHEKQRTLIKLSMEYGFFIFILLCGSHARFRRIRPAIADAAMAGIRAKNVPKLII